jgi:hypothetical protein
MTFEKNLAVAKKVLEQIKRDVTSSDDIIPSVELPHIFPHEMASYERKFGEDKMGEMMRYNNYSSILRNRKRADETFKRLEKEGKISPWTTMNIAVTMMGIGECSETSNLAAILLCQKGCQAPINVLMLKGLLPNGKSFSHAVVVIGNCEVLTGELESFKQLSDDCVLIDPLIGVVGRANQIQTLEKEKEYIKVFDLTSFSEMHTINPLTSKKEVEEIVKNAEQLSQEWRKTIDPYQKSSSKETAKTAQAAIAPDNGEKLTASTSSEGTSHVNIGLFGTDPHTKLLVTLKPFEKDITVKAAFTSINDKKYGQAIRRICTVNSETSNKMLKIMLSFKDALSINIDEQAGEKKQNALHLTAINNNRIGYDLLIASGANPDIESFERKKEIDYFPAKISPSNS